jgi:hypothetical protein
MDRRENSGTLDALQAVEMIDELIPRPIPFTQEIVVRIDIQDLFEIPANRRPVPVNRLNNAVS